MGHLINVKCNKGISNTVLWNFRIRLNRIIWAYFAVQFEAVFVHERVYMSEFSQIGRKLKRFVGVGSMPRMRPTPLAHSNPSSGPFFFHFVPAPRALHPPRTRPTRWCTSLSAAQALTEYITPTRAHTRIGLRRRPARYPRPCRRRSWQTPHQAGVQSNAIKLFFRPSCFFSRISTIAG